MERSDGQPAPEFSHPVRLSGIGPGKKRIALKAGQAENAGLARRFGLDAITMLAARLSLLRREPGIVGVSGVFEAEFAINDPDSGCPMVFTASDAIEEVFVTPDGLDALQDRQAEECADVEIVADDIIDLGELVAQHLALALDPALLEIGSLDADAMISSAAAEEPRGEDNPFAALAGLPSGRGGIAEP